MPRRTRRERDLDWAIYGRCFLFTLGALFFGLALWLYPLDPAQDWVGFVVAGFLAFGHLLIVMSLFAPARIVEDWADRSSRHEAALLVMLLAFPLYRFIKLVRRKG